MSTRPYSACIQAVTPNVGNPPTSFLDQIIDTISSLPDDVFAPNPNFDIYSVMAGALGPYQSLLQRRAVMCEVLRVQAGFESDWNWNEGVDTNNQRSMTNLDAQETGAFQVSADSMPFDPSLSACVDRALGNHNVQTFIDGMKSNHALAVEYVARLLRFSTRWCGTIDDPSMVIANVSRAAMAEFQSFLQPTSAASPAPMIVTALSAALPASSAAAPMASSGGGGISDQGQIANLIALGSNPVTLDSAQKRAAAALLAYDGEVYPQDGCAITLSTLLQDAGINVPAIFRAFDLGNLLLNTRSWQQISLGSQQPGDVGSTCGSAPQYGSDHIYLVLKNVNNDEMVVADNQATAPHFRFASGQGGKTPTAFFLRAS
jgi:hypothetical protein